jgi:hypothetical protein
LVQPKKFRRFKYFITNLCVLFRPRTRPTAITGCLLCCWLHSPGLFIALSSVSSSTGNRTCPLAWRSSALWSSPPSAWRAGRPLPNNPARPPSGSKMDGRPTPPFFNNFL